MHILKQCLVDSGSDSFTCVVHKTAKIFQYGVVQANRDLRLSRLRLDDGTALGFDETGDIAIGQLRFFRVSSGVCSPAKQKSLISSVERRCRRDHKQMPR